MNKIKVLSIFGTRPEAIKMAPLVLELKRRPEIESYCCVTAQHREMLDQVLKIFDITPDFDLDIMQQSQTLTSITSRALIGLENVLKELKPDIVLVHGDTSTTFAGALASFYQQITVGHVEAGLRTYDIYSPFPEEMNRLLTSRIAGLHFCPTTQNKKNLEAEGITNNLYLTGNTAIDTVKLLAKDEYVFENPYLNTIDFDNKRIILLTAHRRENYGEPFENIMSAVTDLVNNFEDIEVIYPMHKSPVVREVATRHLGNNDRVHLIEPLDINDNLNLMNKCFMVMTDSGGIQEEAPAFGKPVLVLRKETERPEAAEAGTAKLAGIVKEEIYAIASELLTNKAEYNKMAKATNPYGDGHASEYICDAIIEYFSKK